MMTQMQMLHIFWDAWGNHDLDYYRVYVECGAITADQYKQITGKDYVDASTSTSANASESVNTATSQA